MTIALYPVLLAGGAGTRLWPLSRRALPKQFVKILGDFSLFQQSALRLVSSDKVKFNPHLTITNNDFRFYVREQLANIGLDEGQIIIEPEGKDTAAAILLSCLYTLKQDPDAILLVAPSDHVIPDIERFHDAVLVGVEEAKKGQIVTFGVKPDRPETGYGYLKLKHPTEFEAVALEKFVEKPDLANAEKMYKSGEYLWNAGIFMFKASSMLGLFEKYLPSLVDHVSSAIEGGHYDLGFCKLDQNAWGQCEKISVDFGIMEKADNLTVVPFQSAWSDLGGWDAVWKELKPDENGVVTSQNALAMDCRNVLLRTESKDQQIVGLGLENIVVVSMNDAVLVANKDAVQNVKEVVAALENNNVSQADKFLKDHRPWGNFEILSEDDGYKVKKILVNPGAALSLQSHEHRSEHWVVVEGSAKVSVDGVEKSLSVGESIYVPVGSVHRLENPNRDPLLIIEVQTGAYLGEDDIKRYEDLYARISG